MAGFGGGAPALKWSLVAPWAGVRLLFKFETFLCPYLQASRFPHSRPTSMFTALETSNNKRPMSTQTYNGRQKIVAIKFNV